MTDWVSFGCAIAIGAFEISIVVTDVIYETVKGVDIQKRNPITRTIRGAIDPSGSFKLQQTFGDSWNDGDLAIFTTSNYAFKILQSYDPSGTAAREQSFIIYQGHQYRVVDKSDWVPQASLYVWRATRHAVQDLT